MASVGKSIPRIDAHAKVTGEALYPSDIKMPGELMMKVLFANRPHAIVKSINISEALQFPGVIEILTARDVPINEYGLIMSDQPVLCGPGSNKPYADRVRFEGDQLALVIAETDEAADNARKLIQVEYEDLPVISDALIGMQPGAFLLHPENENNIVTSYRIRKGDIQSGFREADVIIEGTYKTPFQEHAYLQPEAGLGYMDDEGRVTIIVGGQWTHEDQEQIAHSLMLPKEQIRVIYPAIGGAFGGREDMSVQIILALAVWKLHSKGINRPIKIVWTREESIIGHHKRHPYYIKTKWGAKADGRLLAAEAQVISDAGAYAYTSTKVLGNATLMCTGPYDIPNVSVDSCTVYTNNIPTGAFRGFGGPQGLFAAESQMNKLAEILGIDPVEMRLRNVLQEGSLLSVGTPLPKGVSIQQVVERCAIDSGWVHNKIKGWHKPEPWAWGDIKEKQLVHGVGFACGYKNVGFSFGAPEQCTATIELIGDNKIDKAILYHAAAEVGQGVHTVMAQMVADALNVDIGIVNLVCSDTATSKNSGSVSASRMTFMAGNAIRGAANLALIKWSKEERPAKATYQYLPPKTTPYDPETGKSEPNFAYGYVAESVEVGVDMDTGEVKLINVVSANDVGKAVNPQQVVGQIEGAIIQAAGYGLLENFIQKDGVVQTRTLSTYLIPTIMDIPEKVTSIIVEYPDPIGPWGARGVGEMSYLPLVPAITAAVHAATGIWFDEFPLTPERVLNGIGKIPE
jgi:CO/xanthine dehydrogenase Mo-binding subunit